MAGKSKLKEGMQMKSCKALIMPQRKFIDADLESQRKGYIRRLIAKLEDRPIITQVDTIIPV